MKKLLVVAMLLLGVAMVSAQVNVTYRIDVSTISGVGVTDSTHTVQVCGSEVGPAGQDLWQNNFLTWDDASPLCTHVVGNIWELTIAYPDSMIGWRMAYKARYKSEFEESYNWENGDNRMWVLPATDTTLAIAYVNNAWNPPYTQTDSFDVYFRVNMGANDGFDPETQTVYMVGAFPGPDGADNMWDPAKYALTREGDSDFWGIDLKLPDNGAGYDSTMYRFALGSWDQSENVRGHGMFPDNENRGISIFGDSSITWVWWNDLPAAQVNHQDEMTLTFQADMANAIQNRGFAFGDTLYVRAGYFQTATNVEEAMMLRQGLTSVYAADITLTSTAGATLDYQYYAVKNGLESRETYYNFYYDGSTTGEAERRQATDIADGLVIADVEDSQTELHRMPVFPSTQELSQNVLVTWTCDLRPAYYTVMAGNDLNDIQGNLHVTNAADVFAWGVAMNGPATGNWDTWGAGLMAEGHQMYDDGTHGDGVAGDSIYAIQFTYGPDSTNGLNYVGQVFKFGIGGGDNEGGEGGFGNNHIENIDDTQSTCVINTQFGSINPAYYIGWNYDTQTDVEEDLSAPVSFELEQNYPNPFNPSTTIKYGVAKGEMVTIEVYNMLGQKVATLVNEKQSSGRYEVEWNASEASSGMYFYRITAGDYKKTMKMLLLK